VTGENMTRNAIARRLRAREVADEIRQSLGMPPMQWPPLAISDARDDRT